MRSVPQRSNIARFGMPKFRITLILAVILAGTGIQLPSASAVQSQSLLSTMGLTGPVRSATAFGGFVSGLKPPIFINGTTGAVIAPPSSAPKGPLTIPVPSSTGKPGKTGKPGGGSGGVTAITNAAAGITGSAVTVGAQGPQST